MLCLTLEVDNQSAQEMSGGLYNTKQVKFLRISAPFGNMANYSIDKYEFYN